MAIEIYWGSGSPFSWRVLLTLELKGIKYQSKRLEFSRAEHKSAEYLRLNPRGLVPTLRDGDFVLSESLAIMAYLDRRYPQPPLFGTSPDQTGRIWRTVLEFRNYVEPAVDRIVRPVLFGGLDERAADIRAAADTLHGELGRLDTLAGEGGWLVGGRAGAADLAAYPFVAFVRRIAARPEVGPLELGLDAFASRYPALERWCDEIRALPGYERAYPPHWRQDSAGSS